MAELLTSSSLTIQSPLIPNIPENVSLELATLNASQLQTIIKGVYAFCPQIRSYIEARLIWGAPIPPHQQLIDPATCPSPNCEYLRRMGVEYTCICERTSTTNIEQAQADLPKRTSEQNRKFEEPLRQQLTTPPSSSPLPERSSQPLSSRATHDEEVDESDSEIIFIPNPNSNSRASENIESDEDDDSEPIPIPNPNLSEHEQDSTIVSDFEAARRRFDLAWLRGLENRESSEKNAVLNQKPDYDPFSIPMPTSLEHEMDSIRPSEETARRKFDETYARGIKESLGENLALKQKPDEHASHNNHKRSYLLPTSTSTRHPPEESFEEYMNRVVVNRGVPSDNFKALLDSSPRRSKRSRADVDT